MSGHVTVTLAQMHNLMDVNGMQVAAMKVAADLHMQPVTVDQFFAKEAQAGF